MFCQFEDNLLVFISVLYCSWKQMLVVLDSGEGSFICGGNKRS